MTKSHQVLVNRNDLHLLLLYLYEDEKRHYEESETEDKENHIFLVIESLKQQIGE